MPTEDIEGPGGRLTRVIVAPGRTLQNGPAHVMVDGFRTPNPAKHMFEPGEELELPEDEAHRLAATGFVHFPGAPTRNGVPVDTDPIGVVKTEVH